MNTPNTTNWKEFPFEYNGVNFVSKLAPTSPFLAQIKFLPEGMFESMNKSAVKDLIGENLTRDYISNRLTELNENATHAILELAE